MIGSPAITEATDRLRAGESEFAARVSGLSELLLMTLFEAKLPIELASRFRSNGRADDIDAWALLAGMWREAETDRDARARLLDTVDKQGAPAAAKTLSRTLVVVRQRPAPGQPPRAARDRTPEQRAEDGLIAIGQVLAGAIIVGIHGIVVAIITGRWSAPETLADLIRTGWHSAFSIEPLTSATPLIALAFGLLFTAEGEVCRAMLSRSHGQRIVNPFSLLFQLGTWLGLLIVTIDITHDAHVNDNSALGKSASVLLLLLGVRAWATLSRAAE